MRRVPRRDGTGPGADAPTGPFPGEAPGSAPGSPRSWVPDAELMTSSLPPRSPLPRDRGRASARLVERQVELEHVDAPLAQHAQRPAGRVLVDEGQHRV